MSFSSLAALTAFAATIRAEIEATGIAPVASPARLMEGRTVKLARRVHSILEDLAVIEDEAAYLSGQDREWADAYTQGWTEGMGIPARADAILVEMEMLRQSIAA